MSPKSEIFITESDFRNRYQYNEGDLLGEGGFAQVYKAFDKQFQEYVALKFYNKGEQGKYDVLHEMKDSRRYSHPNVIRVHDAFVVRFDHTGGQSFVQVGVIELANGGNLRNFIQSKPAENKFVAVLIGILDGLEYLHHEKKLIHRDLSPENILMYVEDDTWTPKIADFGISKKIFNDSADQTNTQSTQLLGKVDYMAPEQFYPEKYGIGGKIYTNVDLWAFGVILYELFMLKRPFGGSTQDNPLKTIQSITNDHVILTEIPEPYRAIIKKCLEKNANARVKSAGELKSILLKTSLKKITQPIEIIPVERSKAFKKSTLYLSIGIIVVLTISIIGYIRFRPEKIEKTLSNPPLQNTIQQNNYLTEIKTLINKNDYYQVVTFINQLPDSLKSQKEYLDLYNRSLKNIKSKQLDSFLNKGNQLYDKMDYNASLVVYRRILREFDPSNLMVRNRIDTINILLKQDKTSKPTDVGGLYKRGMFSARKNPASSDIDLTSIEITNNATVISIKLKAGESRYFGSPGNKGAYYIELKNREQKLELKDITGIRTGTFVVEETDKIVQLYFDKLPWGVNEFNLINGDELFHKEYKHTDFIGVKLK